MTESDVVMAAWREFDDVPDLYHIGLTWMSTKGSWAPTLVFTLRDKRVLWGIQRRLRIPSRYMGCVTSIRDIGRVRLMSGAPDERHHDVARGGVAIRLKTGSGTLGCFVRTTESHPRGAGRIALLTCQHVLLSAKDLNPGSARSVGQPESHGCCESCDFQGNIIAHVRSSAHLSEDADSAIAELRSGTRWAPEIYDEPSPIPITGTHQLTEQDLAGDSYFVWKRGIATGRTESTGVLTGVASVDRRGEGTHSYVHRHYRNAIEVLPVSGRFGDHGDSGAALLNANNEVLGICFAAGEDGSVFADPIGVIETIMRVRVATASNTPSGIQVAGVVEEPAAGTRPRAQLNTRSAGSLLDSREILRSLRASDVGLEVERALLRHRPEVERLAVRTRAIAAWRYWGGPMVVERISEGIPRDAAVLPSSMSHRETSAAIAYFAAQVHRLASPALRADLARLTPAVQSIVGMSVQEIAAFSLCAMAPETMP